MFDNISHYLSRKAIQAPMPLDKRSFNLLFMRIVGLGLALLLQLVLARVLGKASFGLYSSTVSMGAILAVALKLGGDVSIIRLTTRYTNRKAWPYLNGVRTFFLHIILTMTFLLSFLVFVYWMIFPDLFNKDKLTLFAAIAIAVSLSLFSLARGYLIALGYPQRAMALEYLLFPILLIVSSSLLLFTSNFEPGLVAVLLHALTITLLMGVSGYWGKKKTPEAAKKSGSKYLRRQWLSLSAPMILTYEGSMIIINASILLTSYLTSLEETALLTIAIKLSALVTIGLTSLNSVASSEISQAYETKNRQAMQEITIKYTKYFVVIGILTSAVIITFSPFLLSFFGSGFYAAQNALIMLALAQLLSLCFGPITSLLSMSGQQKLSAQITFFSIMLLVAGCPALIYLWGLTGAAVALSIVVVLRPLAMSLIAQKTLHIRAFIY